MLQGNVPIDSIVFYLQILTKYEWREPDSNQGPLPYQGSKSISGASCPVRASSLFALFSVLQALLFSCSVRLCSSWVAARLLHTERARQDSKSCDPRIRSPKTYVLACPSVSGNLPYLRGYCRFRKISSRSIGK